MAHQAWLALSCALRGMHVPRALALFIVRTWERMLNGELRKTLQRE